MNATISDTAVMNQISTTTWSPMVSAPEEDFASFLEFGDLQLQFPSFDGVVQDGRELQQEPTGTMDTSMGNEQGLMRLEDGHMQQDLNQGSSMQTMNGFQGSTDSYHDLSMHSDLYTPNQRQQLHIHAPHQYHGQNMIPPTPNSIEMHGDHTRYYRPSGDHQTQAVYEHFGRNPQKDQMIFTPLVSPAVTPLDTQFQYPEYEYPVPGEYFSPLTSPALEAQRHANQQSAYGVLRNSDTSDTASPVDINIDFSAPIGTQNSMALRKSRRKPSTVTKSTGRAVKQSPSMKPQSKKKNSVNSTIPSKEVPGIIENAQKSKKLGVKVPTPGINLGLPYNNDSSEAGSISPEPLSDILMPPPATPRSSSSSRSPYLNAKQPGSQSAPMVAMSGEAATPASLMKIRREAEGGGNRSHEDGELMEDITLPGPADTTGKPRLTPLDTSNGKLDRAPTFSAQRDKITPQSITPQSITPQSITPQSAPGSVGIGFFSSPRISAGLTSPNGILPTKSKATGRDSKKRNTNSSIHVSPALRPKMSPSIKPLLPEGVNVNADTSALLLASKSNYQNILEGTHLPGVSYPEALSTNLTSKRTSHKIAEQGRRNRINTALQEIALLLPPPPATNGSSNQSSGSANIVMTGTAAQQSNSKASTVEMAIEYIKSLQAELKTIKVKLADAENRLDSRKGDS